MACAFTLGRLCFSAYIPNTTHTKHSTNSRVTTYKTLPCKKHDFIKAIKDNNSSFEELSSGCDPELTPSSRRHILSLTATISMWVGSGSQFCLAESVTNGEIPPPSKKRSSIFSGLLSTKQWKRFRGKGFSFKVPPDFVDTTEPEENSRPKSTLYGERVKEKPAAAQFASPDGSKALSVVIKPSTAIKITFLEAQDISEFGSLRDAAGLFVPGGATLYLARTIKSNNLEKSRTYYYYEFLAQDRRVALEAAVSRGKVFVVGGSTEAALWEKDAPMLRSAVLSFSLA